MTVRMDGKAEHTVSFDPAKLRQFDHGYAVTSHSSQGLTQDRVLANFDTGAARSLVNTRLAYVAVSRASQDDRIYPNDADFSGQAAVRRCLQDRRIEILRTEVKSEIRQAVEQFRAGQTDLPIDKLKDQSKVHQHAQTRRTDLRRRKGVCQHARTDRRSLRTAGRSSGLTAQIRAELQQAGQLAPDRGERATVLKKQHFRQDGRAAD